MTAAPVDRLVLVDKSGRTPDPQPIFGGYARATGVISLFGSDSVYRFNFKTRTIQQALPLNAGAQARYDAAEPGTSFDYGGVTFRRLSDAEIIEICASGSFRLSSRL